jgi:D-sedoheptulose 7-phosphate isomerase
MSDKILGIESWIEHSIRVKRSLLEDKDTLNQIYVVAEAIADTFKHGGKVLVCGNGGSSSDSAHIAGEFNNQLSIKRNKPLPAIDLSAMNATMTAISNDYSFDSVFEKQVRGFAKAYDTFIGISTSGTSRNVLLALRAAHDQMMKTVLLTGRPRKVYMVDNRVIPTQVVLSVDSDKTPFIQESHIMILHIISNLVDSILFGVDYLEDDKYG